MIGEDVEMDVIIDKYFFPSSSPKKDGAYYQLETLLSLSHLGMPILQFWRSQNISIGTTMENVGLINLTMLLASSTQTIWNISRGKRMGLFKLFL